MSSSLVKKALELLESEPVDSKNLPKRGPKNKLKVSMKAKKRSTIDHRLRILGDVKSEAALQVDRARRRAVAQEDNTAGNLEQLISYSSFKAVHSRVAEKIFDQTVKTRKQPIGDIALEEKSVFTEEDFKKFEEEYFVT